MKRGGGNRKGKRKREGGECSLSNKKLPSTPFQATNNLFGYSTATHVPRYIQDEDKKFYKKNEGGSSFSGAVYESVSSNSLLPDGENILKVFYDNRRAQNEIEMQKRAGDIAPQIKYNGKHKVKYTIGNVFAFGGDEVTIMIMENLSKDYDPVSKDDLKELLGTNINKVLRSNLINLVYSLSYEKGLLNDTDLTGYTGDHLFSNSDYSSLRLIDYGEFKPLDTDNTLEKFKAFFTMLNDIDLHIHDSTFDDARRDLQVLNKNYESVLNGDCGEKDCEELYGQYLTYHGLQLLEEGELPPLSTPSLQPSSPDRLSSTLID